MPKIREYYKLYAELKPSSKNRLKSFSNFNREFSILKYINANTKDIISNINFAFFPSNEPYLLSIFSSEVNFVHINTHLTQKPCAIIFENINEYENYLSFYATTAILFNQHFQIQNLNDSTNLVRETLKSLANRYLRDFYSDDFNLNLERFTNKNNILRFVYRHGYDFLLQLFKKYSNDKSFKSQIKEFVELNDDEFNELYTLYTPKIVLETSF